MTTILFAAVALQSNQLKGLEDWPIWISAIGIDEPTGTNGLEEAAAACYLHEKRGLDNLVNRHLAGDADNKELLAYTEKFEELIPYIDASISKPWTHKVDGVADNLPAIRNLRILNSGSQMYALAQFLQGNPNRGAASLLRSLRLSRKSGELAFPMGTIASVSSASRVLAEYAVQLDRLPAAGLETLVFEVDRQLQMNHAARSFRGMGMVFQSGLEDIAAVRAEEHFRNYLESANLGDVSDDEVRFVFEEIAAKDAQASHICASEPEHKWQSMLRQSDDAPKRGSKDQQRLFDMFQSDRAGVGLIAARMRTQLRILRLSALVRLYELQTGDLPDSLSELDGQEAVYDPLANAPFSYSKNHERFSILSQEGATGGQIGITYTRPKKSDQGGFVALR
jgi:hypothetical protein